MSDFRLVSLLGFLPSENTIAVIVVTESFALGKKGNQVQIDCLLHKATGIVMLRARQCEEFHPMPLP
jgi:hypothetical protein